MQALANFIMRSPIQAVLVAVATALLSLIPILNVVSVISGAAIALVTLRKGGRQGAIVLIGSAMVIAVIVALMQSAIMSAVLAYLLVLWLPLWLLAMLLRSYASWTLVLNGVIAASVLGLLVVYLALGDPAQYWQTVLKQMLDAMAAQSGGVEALPGESQLAVMAQWMTAVMFAFVSVGLISSLLLARWWQSLLYNPGGFRQEFHGLSMSRAASIAALAMLTLTMVGGVAGQFAADLLMVLMVLFSLAGLALLHCIVTATGKHKGWLIAVYVLMILVLPYVMVILAALGFSDSWFDFRSRLTTAEKGGAERDDKQD